MRWKRKHGIRTYRNCERWYASNATWVSSGETEDEAMFRLAHVLGIRIWITEERGSVTYCPEQIREKYLP